MLLKRDLFDDIKKYLDDRSILVLHGARQVGKTSIMQYLINELKDEKKFVLYHDLEDFRFLDEYNKDIDSIHSFWKSLGVNDNQKNYIFIDEIQYLKAPSSFLKLTHDSIPQVKLIVSGSSSFEIKSKFKDSLVGRTINFEVLGLNFTEFLRFKNIPISLKEISSFSENLLKKYWQEYMIYGSYPQIALENIHEKKERYIKQIINTYIEKDIRQFANLKNIQKFNDFIRILAHQAGELLNISEIANTLRMAESTVNDYLFLLENTYIIKRVYPFHKNIRSEITKMPKIYFEDSGILNVLKNKQIISEIDGNLFENCFFTYLRKKYDVLNIYFWRTNTQKEIDFIINEKNFKAIEVKYFFRGKKDIKHLKYFLENYGIKKGYVCALNQKESFDLIDVKFPWEF